MARFHGLVGYGESVETPPGSGVWKDTITKSPYTGDVLRNAMNPESKEVNSDITVQNSISIVADEYAIKHFFLIKFVGWQGVYWTVTSVEVQSPRLLLRLGKVYNGPTS